MHSKGVRLSVRKCSHKRGPVPKVDSGRLHVASRAANSALSAARDSAPLPSMRLRHSPARLIWEFSVLGTPRNSPSATFYEGDLVSPTSSSGRVVAAKASLPQALHEERGCTPHCHYCQAVFVFVDGVAFLCPSCTHLKAAL